MRRWFNIALTGAAMATLAGLGIRALAQLPGAGAVPHPYGSRAVTAAIGHATDNAVASMTLDERGFDTLGEEMLLLAAATGTILLLRKLGEESRQESGHGYGPEDVFEAVRLVGYLLLPLTLLVGAYIVLHGHLSPGGGRIDHSAENHRFFLDRAKRGLQGGGSAGGDQVGLVVGALGHEGDRGAVAVRVLELERDVLAVLVAALRETLDEPRP